MIHFFRRIRQGLLSQNRFSKYMLYAIGEILLVVVGILIALQINNHNIYKQERSIEITYLTALKEEFEANLNILEQTIDLNNNNIEGAAKLIELFQFNVMDTISEGTVVTYLSKAFLNEVNYTPSTGVIKEIISSGNLKLIQNQELKHKLAGFESSLDAIKHQENEIHISRLEIFELWRNYGNLKKYFEEGGWDFNWESMYENRSNKDLFTSLNFFNGLFFYQGMSIAGNQQLYIPVKQDFEVIISLIDSELNNN